MNLTNTPYIIVEFAAACDICLVDKKQPNNIAVKKIQRYIIYQMKAQSAVTALVGVVFPQNKKFLFKK